MKKLYPLWLLLCFSLGLFAQGPGNRSFRSKNNNSGENEFMNIANSTSHIYYEAGKFDSSLYYGRVALKEAREKNMTADIYMARFNIIASLIRLKKLNEAEKELMQLHRKDFPPEQIRFLIHYYVLLGNYQLAQKNKPGATAYYDTALNIANKIQQPELRLFVYRNMAESFYDLSDFKTACEYYQKYNQVLTDVIAAGGKLGKKDGPSNREALVTDIKYLNNENEIIKLKSQRETERRRSLEKVNKLKDSILQQEKLLSAANARADSLHYRQLQDERKWRSALQRENYLQLARLSTEKKLRLSLLFGLSIAIALAAIIFYQLSRQKNKNAIIKKQSAELQTLLKEIHHRVKNNMQIVSSLLDLQSYTIKDEGASEAVKDSRNRVQSMALIHQNLYREGNIKSIPMEDYIQNLAQNLFDSYSIKSDKVKLKTDIDDLDLDVDTVIPIGLVVNELITNSLKYAFKGRESGELAVVLKQKHNELILEVRDNGNGFPEGWDSRSNHSFGYKLIKAFAQKLKAKLDAYNDNGACVIMHITKYKMA